MNMTKPIFYFCDAVQYVVLPLYYYQRSTKSAFKCMFAAHSLLQYVPVLSINQSWY